MKPGFILFFTLSLFLFSCFPEKDALQKSWFFAYKTVSKKGKESGPDLNPSHFLQFKKDGSFTRYIDGFTYGRYEKKDNFITLREDNGKTTRYKIISLNRNELILDLTPELKNEHYFLFTGFSNNNVEPADDPFGLENNNWRIPPVKEETDEELTARLKNYFHYWETYFKWGIKNELSSLDVRSLKGPIKMYSNGFTLVPYEELDKSWTDCFYNEKNAYAAWLKLKLFMQEEDIAWPKTENRFHSFIGAFQQVQEKMK